MKAYSEDLRRKIVDAVRRGVPKGEAATLFGVSLSSVKRFARMEREGDSLAPKKPPGRPPKGTDATRRLLLADLAERPAASAPQRRRYLERMTGESMSDSTVRRLVRRLGHSRKKKITPRLRARRVPESGLAGDGLGGALRQKARVRGRDGIEHLPSRALRLFSQGREGVLLSGAKPGQEHDAAF
jgi:transposase